MQATPAAGRKIVIWRAAWSAMCTGLIGIGLARFAYSPLIPALIAEQWFSPAQAAYLGAANLAGYLLGALLAGQMTRIGSSLAVLRAMMLVAAASFFACAFPLPFAWFFAWRFASGFSGAVLMVLSALTVLPHVPPGQRGRVGGAIFTGIGFGVVASGTLVPVLMRQGLTATWMSFGLFSLVLTAMAWTGWPREAVPHPVSKPADAVAPERPTATRPLVLLCVEYGLTAAGIVPHVVFLVDFVARGLGRGLAAGGFYWTAFGIGSVTGPLLVGAIADRLGFKRTLRLSLLVQAAAVGLLVVSDRPAALIASSVGVGLFVPGVVPVVLGRMHEIVHDARARQAAWSWLTTAFAAGQAVAAYGFSFLFVATGGAYALLFGLGAAALFIAFVLDLAPAETRPNP